MEYAFNYPILLKSLFHIDRNETNAMGVAVSLLQRRSSNEDDSELLSEYLPFIYFTFMPWLNTFPCCTISKIS